MTEKKKTAKRFAIIIPLITGLMCLVAFPSIAAEKVLTDITITDAVEDEMELDSAVPSHSINIITNDGVVAISGSVNDILAKERAAKIARMVKGVRSVVNNIEVDPPVMRTDWQIKEDVEKALVSDPATDYYEIGISVEANVVTLSGTVQSWQEKELCGKVVKGVKGVKEIKNNIMVLWPEERSDYEIKNEVEAALEWDTLVDNALIDVEVDDAKVILSGTVGSAAEKNRAVIEAYVHGVKSVDSSALNVKKWARDEDLKGKKYIEKPEENIETAIKDALAYDPRVFAFDITPEMAENGKTVILRGTVDNLKAKRAAEQDARNTVGVWDVENRIKVRPEEEVSDKKIEDNVKSALLRDPQLESYEISVNVVNGVANLYGTVDTYYEKSRADDVTSKVKGVLMVDNHLSVEYAYEPDYWEPYIDEEYTGALDSGIQRPRFPSESDWKVKTEIESELWWSPFVDSDDVDVTVEEGVATLTGTVDSWSEYNAAADNAYQGGAVYVDNELKVE